MPVTHQDGDVRGQARAQFALGILEARRALLTAIEQGDDMAGATGCQLLAVDTAGDRLFAFSCQHCRAALAPVNQQLFATPLARTSMNGNGLSSASRNRMRPAPAHAPRPAGTPG